MFFSRLAEDDTRNTFQFLVIYNHLRIHGGQLLGLLEIVSGCTEVLQSFLAKCSAEICIRVFRILFNDSIKIGNRLLMMLDHLVCLGSFVDVLDLGRYEFDALCEWEDRLLKVF